MITTSDHADLDSAFGIRSENDDKYIHHNHFCQKCMYTLQNCKKRKTVITTIAVSWSSHHTENCATCLQACKQVVRGRPKKHVQPGKLKTVKTIGCLSN